MAGTDDIARWFARTGRHQHQTVSLYSSLLTGRLGRYFAYRLRYALVVDGVAFAVHVAEFLIILTALGGLAAFTVMMLRVGSLIVGGAWWGLLEVMRERLRDWSLTRDRESVEREIASWLVLSLLGAALVAAMGTALVLTLLPARGDVAGTLYALLVVVELALRWPVRALHSGMFATRRIWRPRWTLFAPTAVQLVVISAGALVYPTAAVVLAIVVSNAVSLWITVHFTRRLYALNGIAPTIRLTGPDRTRLPRIPPRVGVEATLAGLALRMDAVAVLAIAGVYGTATRSFDLTAGLAAWRDIDAFQFFYLVLPLLRGAYEGTAVFYFDFVRLRRLPALREYRVAFFRRLLAVAPLVALYFWGLAAVLGTVVLPDIPFGFLLALLPLFVVRAFVGVFGLRLFAEGRFRVLALTVVLTAALFVLVWVDVRPASDLLELTAAMLVVLVVHLNVQHAADRTRPAPSQLPLGDWVRTVAAERGPLVIGAVTLPAWIPARQRTAAVDVLREEVRGRGAVAVAATDTVLFHRRWSSDDGARPDLVAQARTGGAVNRTRCDTVADGEAGLERLVARGLIDATVGAPGDPATLTPIFVSTFPDGVVADLRTRTGRATLRAQDEDLLAVLLPAAVRSLDDDALVVTVAGRRLSPLFADARLAVVCLLPSDAAREDVAAWLAVLRGWRLGRADVPAGVRR